MCSYEYDGGGGAYVPRLIEFPYIMIGLSVGRPRSALKYEWAHEKYAHKSSCAHTFYDDHALNAGRAWLRIEGRAFFSSRCFIYRPADQQFLT